MPMFGEQRRLAGLAGQLVCVVVLVVVVVTLRAAAYQAPAEVVGPAADLQAMPVVADIGRAAVVERLGGLVAGAVAVAAHTGSVFEPVAAAWWS